MKLSEWASQQGIHYQTAWTWWRQGKLPVPAIQTPSGTILVQVGEPARDPGVGIYARVSSSDQRADLDRQVARLAAYAAEHQLRVVRIAAEVGSGMSGRRPQILRLLQDPAVGVVLVEHRDRLARMGTELVEATLGATGRRLLVMDPAELPDDLVRDMVEVLTSFCARLYGRRSARTRAARALAATERAV